ncbi:MAG: hypothetical protein HFF10_11525 [Angelakisella sp.]|jgi:hypothetical protein|nr:hypothetical protein [Angelakisella sp.]
MYGMEDFFEAMLMVLLGVLLFWTIVTLTEYILKGIALSRIAQNAGFSSPGLAWVPVANSWLLGSLCDRSQYAFTGKRWHFAVLLPVMDVLGLLGGGIFSGLSAMFADYFFYDSFDHAVRSYGGSLLGVAGTVVLAFGLYRLYQDYAPGREVLFLILSVVFGRLVQAILLMTIRNNVPVSADPNAWGRWAQQGGYPPPGYGPVNPGQGPWQSGPNPGGPGPGGWPPPANPGGPGTTGWTQPPYQSGPNPGGPGPGSWPPPANPGGPGTTGWSQPPYQSGPNPGGPGAAGWPPPANPGGPGTTGWNQPPYQSGPNPGGPGVSGWPPPASPGGPGTTGWSQPPRQSGPNPGSPEAAGQTPPAGSDSLEPPPAQPFRWDKPKDRENPQNGPEL